MSEEKRLKVVSVAIPFLLLALVAWLISLFYFPRLVVIWKDWPGILAFNITCAGYCCLRGFAILLTARRRLKELGIR